jgi:protein-disulfide isomerase
MLAMLGGAALIAILAVGGFILANRDEGAGPAADDPVIAAPAVPEGVAQATRILGDPNAPVKVVEYGDYQCPGCAQFARTGEQQMTDEYIVNGQVSFEFRDFPFIGDESENASEASLCAGAQEMYWPYHKGLYYNFVSQNEGGFARQRLIEIARVAGLDVDAFTTCIDGDEYEDDVEAMLDEARDRNLTQTPTFFVNDQMVSATDYAAIKQAIDAALAQ